MFNVMIGLLLVLGMTTLRAAEPSTAKDENGMRIYYMGFLLRGDKWTPEQNEQTKAIQAGHMQHIESMAKSGKLLIAGPFVYDETDTDQAMRGIFIFDVGTREEALALAAQDPAVKAGRLKIDLRKWYGPYGLTYQDHNLYIDGAKTNKP